MFRLTLGIVGCGFVGSAVASGFDTPNVDSWIVDPKKSTTTLQQLAAVGPHLTFICVPTPQSTDGSVNVTIVDQVLADLNKFAYDGIVVIKSTITPDHKILLILPCKSSAAYGKNANLLSGLMLSSAK